MPKTVKAKATRRTKVKKVARRNAFAADQAIGLAIRTIRTDQGLSQERLAEMAELHRNFVGYIERGERNLSLETLTKLATALQYPAWQLLRDADIKLGKRPAAQKAKGR